MFHWLRGKSRVSGSTQPLSGRYVISIRKTGLGDRLICLAAAWLFARNTGRTLVADWRFSPYLEDPRQNLFARCFQPASELAGVRFLGDDTVGTLKFPAPRYPSDWNDDLLMRAPFMRSEQTFFADRDAAVTLIRGGRDVPEPTVVFDTCINDALVRIEDARAFPGALIPIPDIAGKVKIFREAHFGAGHFIGLHMRHGNGGPTGHVPYWASFPDAIERCVLAVHHVRERLGQDASVLLCTDSPQVERAIREKIPNVLSRGKIFRAEGEGELQVGRQAPAGFEDALIEMLLLAECAALIRFPPGSFFTFYAAVMRRWPGPPEATLYDLQRPWTPGDPLAPAILA